MTLLCISRAVPTYCAICAVYVTSDDCLNCAREFAIMVGAGARLTLDDGTGGSWSVRSLTAAEVATATSSAIADLTARLAAADAANDAMRGAA